MALEMASSSYLGLVRCGSFGRKRISPPSCENDFEDEFDCFDVRCLKRKCSKDSFFCEEQCALEDLPQEILVRILCGVEHDDLRRLFLVSKAIREAAIIAKESHFAYSTPKKTVSGIRNADDLRVFDEIETPKAPKQLRVQRSRLRPDKKKLSEISVALFAV